jgi:hypothetical protein
LNFLKPERTDNRNIKMAKNRSKKNKHHRVAVPRLSYKLSRTIPKALKITAD